MPAQSIPSAPSFEDEGSINIKKTGAEHRNYLSDDSGSQLGKGKPTRFQSPLKFPIPPQENDVGSWQAVYKGAWEYGSEECRSWKAEIKYLLIFMSDI